MDRSGTSECSTRDGWVSAGAAYHESRMSRLKCDDSCRGAAERNGSECVTAAPDRDRSGSLRRGADAPRRAGRGLPSRRPAHSGSPPKRDSPRGCAARILEQRQRSAACAFGECGADSMLCCHSESGVRNGYAMFEESAMPVVAASTAGAHRVARNSIPVRQSPADTRSRCGCRLISGNPVRSEQLLHRGRHVLRDAHDRDARLLVLLHLLE